MNLPVSNAPSSSRTHALVGKGWVQAIALVLLFGYTVMGILAYRTSTCAASP